MHSFLRVMQKFENIGDTEKEFMMFYMNNHEVRKIPWVSVVHASKQFQLSRLWTNSL